jgi:hypothetical protein
MLDVLSQDVPQWAKIVVTRQQQAKESILLMEPSGSDVYIDS